MKKTLFLILDGAADSPSAFAAAKMRNLNSLAAKSLCGIWSGPYAPKYNPKSMSSVATLELLGYSYKDEPGRGYLEALGIGLKPDKNSLYLRANFSTISKNNKIVDRRAGRDDC
jgi:2,3-bisphosphoglycerate-independent phosphoglycerate mutase